MKKLRSLFAIVLAVAIICSFAVISASAENVVTSVSDLKDKVSDGKDVSLGGSFDLTREKIEIKKDITIDLNGYDITLEGDSDYPTFTIDGANVTFTNSKSTGSVSIKNQELSSADGEGYVFYVKNGGTLNFEKAKVEVYGENTVFFGSGGNIIVNSGTFIANDDSYIFDTYSNSKTTINGGTYTNPNNTCCFGEIRASSIEINGGTFGEGNTAFGYGFFIKGDSTATINGGTFKSVMNAIVIMEEYDKLPNVTINSGTFVSEVSSVLEFGAGTLTINGGDFTANSSEAAALFIDNGATATITGGHFKADYGYGIYNAGTLTINDCIAEGFVCGLHSCADTVNLNGGLYSSSFGKYTKAEYAAHYISNEAYNWAKDTAGAIYYIGTATDLLGLLGSDKVCYYSKNGINKSSKVATGIISELSVAVEKKSPSIIDGADQKISGAPKDTSISSDVHYRWFYDGTKIIGKVLVDGKEVDSKNYDSASGSTIIKFKKAYLETLSAGKHKVTIVSNVLGNEIKAETTLTINDKIAQTGDNNAIGAFAAIGVMSAAAFISLKKKEN